MTPAAIGEFVGVWGDRGSAGILCHQYAGFTRRHFE